LRLGGNKALLLLFHVSERSENMTIIMTNMSRRLQYEPLFLSTNEAERKNVGDGKKEKENSFLAVLTRYQYFGQDRQIKTGTGEESTLRVCMGLAVLH
jgi:hypothetical protein